MTKQHANTLAKLTIAAAFFAILVIGKGGLYTIDRCWTRLSRLAGLLWLFDRTLGRQN